MKKDTSSLMSGQGSKQQSEVLGGSMLSVRTAFIAAVISKARSAASANVVGCDDGDCDAPASEPGIVTE